MRVVSGRFRGRVLISPKDDRVRPTSDMIKESVFNIVQDYIPGGRFLDLFAGSGAIGIEAISRGAEEVVFVDSSRDSVQIVGDNLKKLGITARVINADFRQAAMRLQGEKFDVIYLDPPFVYTDIKEMLSVIAENDLLADGGLVVYESLYSTNSHGQIDGYVLQKSKKYGTISIEIFVLAEDIKA